jgi:ATP-dependent DNA helicase DinG
LNKFVVVDFETTGNKAKDGDQIIQVGAVLIEDGEIVSQYSTLVHPGVPIPPFIQQLTKITDDMVKEAPTMDEVLPHLLPMLDQSAFVAHNVFFDLGFLQQALLDHGYHTFSGPAIDTVEMSRILLPNQAGYKLSELSFGLDVEHENPHQADSDAMATAQIFLTLLKKLDDLPYVTIQRLYELTKGFSTDFSSLLASIERKKLVSGKAEYLPENMEIFRQVALLRQEDRDKSNKERTLDGFPTFLAEVDEFLAQELAGFELRPSQREMMEEIYGAFHDSTHLMVEAGTGTGKSLAYLVPSLYWSLESGEKVVISTHTIQLQEQLFTRDLPLMEKLFDGTPSVALLKGRSNYLCLRKFEQSLNEHTDNYDIQLSKCQVLTWLTETKTGDVEELNLPSGGQAFWRQVQSDANSCLGRHCPWFSRCFYHNARQKAQEAGVVITNHSLLFTDLKVEQRVLPPYRYAVIDEAHHFEEVASQHLGLSFSSFQMEHELGELLSDKGMGMLDLLDSTWVAENLPDFRLNEVAQRLQDEAESGKEALRDLFLKLHQWGLRSAREGEDIGRLVKRIDYGFWNQKGAGKILAAAAAAVEWLGTIGKTMESIYKQIQALKELPIPVRTLMSDFNGLIKDCSYYKDTIEQLLLSHDQDYVYWMELETKTNRKVVFLYMVPVDVAPLLNDQYFSQKESVVLTSATLSVNRSFAYPLQQIGLSEQEVRTAIHPSPFDYQKQALLCVPSDFPSLKGASEGVFSSALVESLAEVARATEGRMLVLFTSYQMLRQVYEPLKEYLSAEGFTVLGHGVDASSRTKLVRQFKSTPRCVLLGTSSFWEGVDIPGEALSCLAIVRLPFLPPNQPVVEARSEAIKERNGNPFLDMSVPQAVIRLKQGFGRLVRTGKDKGIVIIFDKRIIEARYGKYFVKSLPETELHAKPMNQLLSLIREWLV